MAKITLANLEDVPKIYAYTLNGTCGIDDVMGLIRINNSYVTEFQEGDFIRIKFTSDYTFPTGLMSVLIVLNGASVGSIININKPFNIKSSQEMLLVKCNNNFVMLNDISLDNEIGNNIETLNVVTERQNADISNLKALAKGQLYNEQVDSTVASVKTVPVGAMHYATLDVVGGMSRNCTNYLDNSKFNTSYGNIYNDYGYVHIQPSASVNYAKIWTGLNIPLKAGETYYYGYEVLDGTYKGGNMALYAGTNTIIAQTSFAGVTKIAKYTPTTNTVITGMGFYAMNSATDIIVRARLGKGANLEKYEPYTDQIIDAKINEVISIDKHKTIPQSVINKCTDYGIGINAICYNYIDVINKKYHHKVSNRDYQDGDENNSNVLTDGTKTYYPITEEIIDLSDVLDENFDILEVEPNGTLTFNYPSKADGYDIDVPNTETYLINLQEAIANE